VGDGRVFVGPKNADLTIVKKMEGVLQAGSLRSNVCRRDAGAPFVGGTPMFHLLEGRRRSIERKLLLSPSFPKFFVSLQSLTNQKHTEI
jgi:hypothetical protein